MLLISTCLFLHACIHFPFLCFHFRFSPLESVNACFLFVPLPTNGNTGNEMDTFMSALRLTNLPSHHFVCR